MALPEPPRFAAPRPSSAIPRTGAGHTGLLAGARRCRMVAGLRLCGFGWTGIGINDMVKEARRAAEAIWCAGGGDGGPEVKGVDF